MNVLFIIITPGGSAGENGIALVPIDKLQDVDLEIINDKMLNVDEDMAEEVMEQIVILYKRFGLESQPDYNYDLEEGETRPAKVPVDLKQYINPQTPFQVDRVIRIGWAL